MHPAMDTVDPLTAKLAGVMLVLMKSSQNEVMEITAEFDLTLSQLRILFIVDHAEHDLAVNEIAERLSLSMPATGRAVDALHRHGLLARREDEADRRIKRITLTEAGTAATMRIATARVRSVQTILAGLDDDERERLDDAATTLADVLADHLPTQPTPCAPTARASTSQTASA